MPPERVPKNRRTGLSFARMADMDFAKQLQVFAIHDGTIEALTLRNGDTVVKGDCVEIGPGKDYSKTSATGERWVAEVLETKADKRPRKEKSDEDSTEVSWVHVRWFYTEYNLKHYNVTVGNLWSCTFGKRELALSDHEQVLRSDAILRKVDVRFFDESDREQPQIGKGELWYRYFLKTGKRSIDNRLILHKGQSLPHVGCAVAECKKRYIPHEDVQYFCPRVSCEFWYHEQCLINRRFEKGSHHILHRLQAMLQGTPGFEDTPTAFFDKLEEDVNLEEKGIEPEKGWPTYEEGGIWSVVRCALNPIARGKEYGIVGNEAEVREARDLIREIQDGQYPSPEELGQYVKRAKLIAKRKMLGCMRCGQAI